MPDFPPCDDVCGALEEHVRRFFAGRTIEVITWPAGPIQEQNPHFRVLRVEPTSSADVRPTDYVSVGLGRNGRRLRTGVRGLHSVRRRPSGGGARNDGVLQPWRAVRVRAHAACRRALASGFGVRPPPGQPPYPFGTELQTSHVGDRDVEFLWLLPITPAKAATPGFMTDVIRPPARAKARLQL